jgi:hypothetical protein
MFTKVNTQVLTRREQKIIYDGMLVTRDVKEKLPAGRKNNSAPDKTR